MWTAWRLIECDPVDDCIGHHDDDPPWYGRIASHDSFPDEELIVAVVGTITMRVIVIVLVSAQRAIGSKFCKSLAYPLANPLSSMTPPKSVLPALHWELIVSFSAWDDDSARATAPSTEAPWWNL